MSGWVMNPKEIEERSFATIQELIKGHMLEPGTEDVVKRVIHTTADFDYLENLYFSPRAVEKGRGALRTGAHIVCDTNMAKAGVNKIGLNRLGGQVHCFMADEDVAREAQERGITRAAVSMERAAELSMPLIIAVGNAPTALVRLMELIREGRITPALVIAVPVGFVNVVEAKELFVEGTTPAIVARGRKGGSNVAAAICNAMINGCR